MGCGSSQASQTSPTIEKNLPLNPVLWSTSQVKNAAEAIFASHQKQGQVAKDRWSLLFDDCEKQLKFHPDKNEVAQIWKKLIAKHDKNKSYTLSFRDFLPLFTEMTGRLEEHAIGNVRSVQKVAEVRALIVCLNYDYNPTMGLTSIADGKYFERLAQCNNVTDLTMLYDDCAFDDLRFPLKSNVRRNILEIGKRCKPGDLFFFFFAGHGTNTKDQNGDETDELDEAFVLPNRGGAIDRTSCLIDDDFSRYLARLIPLETSILLVTDCCHSGTIVDIDSFDFEHRIAHISAARDSETCVDMSTFKLKGGVLSNCIRDSLIERRAKKDLSVAELFNQVAPRVAKIMEPIKHKQTVGVQTANIEAHAFPWPFLTT